jgi:hypothetical protein
MPEKKFKKADIYGLHNTKIVVWQERDRLQIRLLTSTDKELISWSDDDAQEAIEDGFLDASESFLGNLERAVKQQGALHRSALEYWKEHVCRKTSEPTMPSLSGSALPVKR